MALLLVLMVLVLSVASVASLARLSVATRLSRDLGIDTRLCHDLQRAAHLAIIEWLRRESNYATVAVDADQPRVDVLDDSWNSLDDVRRQRIRIAAWDQLGMVPLSHLRESSPLASELPDGLPDRAAPMTESDAPGLDQVERSRLHRFPGSDGELAVGSVIATHNQRDQSGTGAINVNTAPIALLETAMRLAGRGGIERIIEARSEGRPSSVPSGSGEGGPAAPRLTARSDAWSFRVDLQSGPVRQSWWCTYLFDGSRWSLAQRLLIDE